MKITDIVDVTQSDTRIFNTIALETTSHCNRTCFFCPVAYGERAKENMPIELITKVLNELANVNYKGRIELYIYNESTLDKRLIEIIALVRSKLPQACIMINTNGDTFKTWEDINKYFVAGLNQMQINIYSNGDGKDEERYQKGLEFATNRHEKMLAMVAELKKQDPKVTEEGNLYHYVGPKSKIVKVVPKYGVKPDGKRKFGIHHFSNRSGNVGDFVPALKEPLKNSCAKPFRMLNINWKGEALLCCNDYNGETSVGNIKDNTVIELWNSQKLQVYRLRLQNKNRNMKFCDKCDYKDTAYGHVIQKVTFGEELDNQILETPYLDINEL
jgi:radical SAM protein with 4Fe4S-binding SPASM domain